MDRPCAQRRGSVLLITLILTIVVLLVIGALTQLYRLHAAHLELTALRVQAERYARAGLERGELLLQADPAFRGELWRPRSDSESRAPTAPPEDGDSTTGSHDGPEQWTVRIEVLAPEANGPVTLRATAAFGNASESRVRLTLERRVPTPKRPE
ncbi:MAG: hypothetical protein D6725_17885 [Planctomycetota bacterium]|nr:MAG: hypothetical protein D6725_17885 [Planctomycetota bacterium]